MKTILILLLLTLTATAVPINLAWDDPNPPGLVQKYTLYRKTFTSTGGASWTKIKDVPGGTLTTTVEFVIGQVNVYSITAWYAGIESNAKTELDARGPLNPTNFVEKP